jgi:WS/DGAT/MGAT family acyltransferase
MRLLSPGWPGTRAVVDRASPTDLVMLAMDREDMPEQVGGVLLLEGGPALDIGAAEALLAERIRTVPRLRQRLVPAPPGCGRPVWIDDAGFDVGRHVRQVRCPPPGDEQALLDIAVGLVAERLPRSRPLWSAAFVTGLAGGTVGLVLVLHHVLADGIGGLAVLGALVDRPTRLPAPEFPRRPPSAAELAVDAWQSRVRALSRLPSTGRRLRRSVAAAGGLHAGRAARCSLLQPTGPHRQLAVVRAELARLRAAAHRLGGTVNDVVLAAVAGALQAVLERRAESVDTFVVSVPVAIRRSAAVGQLGNRISPMLVSLPGAGDPAQRVRRVAAQTRIRKAAATEVPPPALIGPVFRVAARLGLVHRYMCRQRQLHTLVTNLRGPDRPLTFAGAPIDDVIPVALGDSGNVTVSFDVLSYAGTLSITVVADPDHVPDLPILAAALQAELAAAGAEPTAGHDPAPPSTDDR